MHVRWMIRPDMPEVLAIERASFEFPWSEEDFMRCLRKVSCIGMVAEDEKGIAGFMLYELRPRCLHICNFAVAEDVRRRGVGRAMADKLKAKLSVRRRSRLVLQVRESNLGAQLFWRAQGFRAVQIVRGAFEETRDDAYRFVYWAPGAPVIGRVANFLTTDH